MISGCLCIYACLHTYIAAVPPRPQDGTVSVIILFTIVFGCVTDNNNNNNDRLTAFDPGQPG